MIQNFIRHFYLSQKDVHGYSDEVMHHRPLTLFFVFSLLVQQFGLLQPFAETFAAQYIYVQNNPVVDDSWIGTPVQNQSFFSPTKIQQQNVTQPTVQKTSSINLGSTQAPSIDTSWIGTFSRPSVKVSSSQVPLNTFPAGPLVPAGQANTNGFLSNGYFTPNGTSFYNITSTIPPSSYTAPTLSYPSSISGNFTVSGVGTFGSLSGSTASFQSMSISSGTGTPIQLLGRDALGQVNGVGVGTGLNLVGGVLSLAANTGSLITSNILSFSGNTFSSSVNGFTGFVNFLTTNIFEGTNLYFTDLRAQNALSGTVSGLQTQINTLSGSLSTLTNTVSSLSGSLASLSGAVSQNRSDIVVLSGALGTLSSAVNSLSGNLNILTTTVSTLSGSLATTQSQLQNLSGSLVALTNTVTSLSGTVSTLSGTVSTILANLSTLSGSLATNIANTVTLSGGLASLSGTVSALSSQVAALFVQAHDPVTLGLSNGLSLSGQVLSLALASSTTTGALSATDWNTFNSKQANIATGTTSQYYRGDKTFQTLDTSVVPENGNLYFTNARTIAAPLTGFVAASGTVIATDTILQAFQKLQGANTIQDTNIAGKIGLTSLSANGPLTYNNLTGVFGIAQANTSTNGFLSSTDWNTFNNKLGFISGTPNGLSISGTGISLGLASASTTGALSSTDWNTFNNKQSALTFGSISTTNPSITITNGANSTVGPNVTIGIGNASSTATGLLTGTDWNTFNGKLSTALLSLNGLTATGQTFALGTAGTDFGIVSVGSTHTFNLPDASGTARGLVSTGTQTFTGAKTFSSAATFSLAPTFSTMTPGSLFFAGTSGTLSQNNANLFWDNTLTRFGIGTATPAATFHNQGSTLFGVAALGNFATGGVIGAATATVDASTVLSIAQTATGQTLTLPNPTNTTAGRIMKVVNTGTSDFTMYNVTVSASRFAEFLWNGSAWSAMVGGGSGGGYSSLDIANLATGGPIGTAAATVDTYTNFNINQTTTLQTLTIPSPTNTTTTKGKVITLNNVGTANFIIGGVTVPAGSYGSAFVWNGTAWNPLNAASNVVAENAYVLKNTAFSTSSTSFVDITGLSITLPSAGNYELTATINGIAADNGETGEFILTDSSNIQVGTLAKSRNNGLTGWYTSELILNAQVSAAAPATYKVRMRSVSGTTLDMNYTSDPGTQPSSSLSYKKISGNTPVTGQMVDYVQAYRTSNQTISNGTVVNFDSVTGNIPASSGVFTLTAGKTYELSAGVLNYTSTVRPIFSWFNITAGSSIGSQMGLMSPSDAAFNAVNGSIARAIITPTTNITVDFRAVANANGSNITAGDFVGGNSYAAWATIKQLGSTATTGTAFNTLTNALSTGTLDNSGLTQTWSWSGLTTGTGLMLTSNTLTTGSLLSLVAANPILNSINGFFNVANNATPTFGTGIFARFQPNSTAGAGLTLLNNGNLGIGTATPTSLVHVQTTSTGDILKVTSGSTNILRVATDRSLALDTAKVTIGSGNTARPEGLARDQLYVYGRINSSWDEFRCDFLTPQNTITVDTYQVCGGLGYDFNTAGSLAFVNLAGVSGADRITSGITANASAGALSSMGMLPTERSLNPVFEARVINNGANARAVVGFHDLALNGAIAADTNNANNEIFFRKAAAGTLWQTVTRSVAGTETVNTTTFSTSVMRILRIEVNDLAGKVEFYIDGTLVATHTTGVPTAATRLGYWVGVTPSTAAAVTMDVDYIRFWSDDPADATATEATNSVTPIDFDALVGRDNLPDIVWNSRSVLKDLNYVYDKSSALAGTGNVKSSLEDVQTIDDFALYAANTTAKSLEKLSGRLINTDLSFNKLSSSSMSTSNLCLDTVCFDSGSLVTRSMLDNILSHYTATGNTSSTVIVQNISTPSATGTTLSLEDQSVLDAIVGTLENITLKVQTFFDEMVTFAKHVVFKASVLFEGRVTFADKDMAGTALIRAGQSSVRVDFVAAYQFVPKVTVSADAFVTYRVTEKGITGFTIETQSPVSVDTSFDWIALESSHASQSSSEGNTQVTPASSAPADSGTTTSIPSAPSESPSNAQTGSSNTGSEIVPVPSSETTSDPTNEGTGTSPETPTPETIPVSTPSETPTPSVPTEAPLPAPTDVPSSL